MPRKTWIAAVAAGGLAGSASGCSGGGDGPAAPPPPAGAPPADARSGGEPQDPDPTAGPDETSAGRLVKPRASNRPGRPIDVMLKSTPPGAMAAVDGRQVGLTPTYWAGEADGREHEFTFVRRGHADARYRFVPVTSGVIHARLDPIPEDPTAGLGPLIAPTLAPEAVPPADEPARREAEPAPPPALAPEPDDAVPAPADPSTGRGPQP